MATGWTNRLACVLETGEEGAPSADDVTKAFSLRKRGKANRARASRKPRRSLTGRKR